MSLKPPNSSHKQVRRLSRKVEQGEALGLGIRAIVFLQGCGKRCMFCCNPDSWSPSAGTLMTASQIYERIKPNIPYYRKSGGGITLSGGECLLQPKFSRALCDLAHAHGLTAALDTAATGSPDVWVRTPVVSSTTWSFGHFYHIPVPNTSTSAWCGVGRGVREVEETTFLIVRRFQWCVDDIHTKRRGRWR